METFMAYCVGSWFVLRIDKFGQKIVLTNKKNASHRHHVGIQRIKTVFYIKI